MTLYNELDSLIGRQITIRHKGFPNFTIRGTLSKNAAGWYEVWIEGASVVFHKSQLKPVGDYYFLLVKEEENAKA